MLSVFPSVLYLGQAFAPFIIRILVSLAVASLAYLHLSRRQDLAIEVARFIKGPSLQIATLAAVIEGIVAAMLFVGIYTQVVALLAAVLFAKVLIFKKSYKELMPESRTFYALLLVLSLLVFLAGPGPFAFDLPL